MFAPGKSAWIAIALKRHGPVLMLLCLLPVGADAAEPRQLCSLVVAKIVSIQGTVLLHRAAESTSTAVAKLDTPICQGDLLQTGAKSRAAVVILPEKFVRIDQNSTISITVAGEETLVEFSQTTAVNAPSPSGAYFITRFPRKFKVHTPYLNAAVEGTEFLIDLSSSASAVAVFEGKVRAEALIGSSGNFVLSSGETISVGPGEPAAVKILVRPIDAVQWALYYPPLSDASAGVDADQSCGTDATSEKSRCLTLRAEQRLRLGRVDDAQTDIQAALALRHDDADAEALAAVISVVKTDKAAGLALGKRATELDPLSPRAWIAYSYAQQASFKLEDALSSAERAAQLAPRSSTAQTRMAELLMSLGKTRSAERAAQAAAEANPNESRAHTILGFVHLAQIDTKKARVDFLAAIERDSSDPLARLGLGLAIIRDGDLVAGREQIEIAVLLDPTNSLIRSYVGKAYYEENSKERDTLASTQFGLAKQLDPKDPTPWFYDAILKESRNRPVEALEDLQRSLDLNDSRAVYRSRLMLDQDRAARTTNLAQLYEELGFRQLAQFEAGRSLTTDPDSYASHRFLADSYAGTPHVGLATESEYLQAQLREPLALVPVSPFRGLTNPLAGLTPQSGVLRAIAPSSVGLNEFAPLFESQRGAVYFDGLAATKQTYADQLIASGLWANMSGSIGQGHIQTEGFGPGQDFVQDASNAFFQVRASDSLSLQAQLASARTLRGTINFPFDPSLTSTGHVKDTSNVMRIGGRYELEPKSSLIFWLGAQTFDEDEVDPNGFQFRSQTFGAEAQYSIERGPLRVIAGLGHLEGTQRIIGFDDPPSVSQDNAYVYSTLSVPSDRAAVQLGVNVSTMEDFGARRSDVSPKLGLTISPTTATTIRAAIFKTIRRQLVANQTIEPTQIAGFNQFYDDSTASEAWQAGAGLDHRLGRSAYTGFEFITRRIEVPFGFQSFYPWDENYGRAYLYWTVPPRSSRSWLPRWSFAFNVEYRYEELSRTADFTGFDYIRKLKTHYFPLGITLFPNAALSLHASATYLMQDAHHQINFNTEDFPSSANVWLADLAVSYRLPGRKGKLLVGVSNLFDKRFTFVESDPVNLRFAPQRLIFGRVIASF